MSKSPQPRLRQASLIPGDTEDADGGDMHRTRASTPAFREHLDKYKNAEIRDARQVADDPDRSVVDSFTVVRHLGNGSRVNLVECPACYAPLRPSTDVGDHIADHSPEDFGLAPLAEDDSGRSKTAPDRREPADGQSSFRDWQP